MLLFGTYNIRRQSAIFGTAVPAPVSQSRFYDIFPLKICCPILLPSNPSLRLNERFLERTSFHSRPFIFFRTRAIRSADCCLLEKRVFLGLMGLWLLVTVRKTQSPYSFASKFFSIICCRIANFDSAFSI